MIAFVNHALPQIAMELLHGYKLQGQELKVESIRDHEKYGRIRAPRKIVDYAVGPIKRQRNGELNTMRRATSRSNDEGDADRSKRREQRRMRMEKRKSRGRYKNQQRKNSRACRLASL